MRMISGDNALAESMIFRGVLSSISSPTSIARNDVVPVAMVTVRHLRSNLGRASTRVTQVSFSW